MTICDENIKIDHNISINAVSNDICKIISADDKKKLSADVPVCDNCGKEGDEVKNTCNKCFMPTYCNAACKKKHRHKHKKQCERRVAELHDIELFKQPPALYEDCPICFLRMPILETGSKYKSCCGKVICSGCAHAPVYDNQGNEVAERKCPFCRTPSPTTEEGIEREKQRVEANDPIAIRNLGIDYRDGTDGHPQDYAKALELYHRAAKFGSAEAYCSIGVAYDLGRGVEVDMKKATYYYELAAMKGNEMARHNLGVYEEMAGNIDRALMHYMIAVRGGNSGSVNQIQKLYSSELATKDDYTKALQSYQEYLCEIKSVQRDKAAAAKERYRYYY